MQILIEAENLVKKYNGLMAVDHLSFQARKGECLGFLGPNGAGKTTTMRMIYGFSPLTEGRLRIFGLDIEKDPRAIKKRIGIAPQEQGLDPDLTVLQNLLIYAGYFDISHKDAERRSKELLRFFQLEEKIKEPIDRLSGGMKRRLLVARALINRPEILILDEPTTGLDPQSRHLMWQRLKGLHDEGVTIILTTHYMEEAERICDRVIVIDFGKIIEEGNPRDLIQRHGGKNLEELFLKLTGKELRDG